MAAASPTMGGFDYRRWAEPQKTQAAPAPAARSGTYAVSQRVFHLKFGYGRIRAIDGNRLTIQFDKAGEKKVIDSFVEPA